LAAESKRWVKNFSEAAAEPKVLVDLEKGKISKGE